jgi:hypothetical protein
LGEERDPNAPYDEENPMNRQDAAAEKRMTQREIGVDQRERNADKREAALDSRENAIRAREAVLVERFQTAKAILGDADERDGQADLRDALANERDKADSFRSFLHDDDFNPGIRARRAAGLDRSDSKHDRASAADDRSRLTDHEPTSREVLDT